MPKLLDNPSEHVKNVLFLARVQAEVSGDSAVRSGHLLLAILSTQECSAVIVLSKLGVDYVELRKSLLVALYQEEFPVKEIPLLELAPDATGSLKIAVAERRALNHLYLTTTHLLLGILRQEENEVITGVIQHLESLGITPDDIRAQFSEFYAENSSNTRNVNP